MPLTIITIQDEMQVNSYNGNAPVKLLMCKIECENAQASLMLSGVKIVFSKNDRLPAKHRLSRTPVALWMSISFMAS